MSHRCIIPLLLLVACRPAEREIATAQQGTPSIETASAEPEPTPDNSAPSLAASASRLRAITVAAPDQRPIATLDEGVVLGVREALQQAAPSSSPQLGPPRWDVVVLLTVDGRDAPFVAHPIGDQTLRLNSIDPWSATLADDAGVVDGRGTEIDVGADLFPAIEEALGPEAEPAKEYQMRPGALDLSKFKTTSTATSPQP